MGLAWIDYETLGCFSIILIRAFIIFNNFPNTNNTDQLNIKSTFKLFVTYHRNTRFRARTWKRTRNHCYHWIKVITKGKFIQIQRKYGRQVRYSSCAVYLYGWGWDCDQHQLAWNLDLMKPRCRDTIRFRLIMIWRNSLRHNYRWMLIDICRFTHLLVGGFQFQIQIQIQM